MGMTRVSGNGNRDVKRLSLLLGEGGSERRRPRRGGVCGNTEFSEQRNELK